MTIRTVLHAAGCLLGGAVGDALGAPVEFLKMPEIRQRYGPAGITEFDVAYGRRGAITDDTQMTLFTAEGVLRAIARSESRGGISHPPTLIHHAYLRWLFTQGERSETSLSSGPTDSWLFGVRELHHRRAPGGTCLSALRAGRMGTRDAPMNDSKGCGGVMRMAPVGLVAPDSRAAFDLGCDAAAVTHGHPSGYYSAGCFAEIICHLSKGQALRDAIAASLATLEAAANPRHEECAAAIRQALTLSADGRVEPSPAVIERMGGGWVGEEALAIALYCALVSGSDFERGVRLAVNHSGDSDSTGAIAGNLLGLMLGVAAIPERWLAGLELREEIEAVARDLETRFDDSPEWRQRYPGV